MDWKLELVVVPVSDVERAKRFYADKLGFNVDFDRDLGGQRIVQLTPPGSACSIAIGTALTQAPPGSVAQLTLVVPDIRAAHAELLARGVENSGIQLFDAGGPRPFRQGDEDVLDNVGFVFLGDPDGNRWAVQQIDRDAQQ